MNYTEIPKTIEYKVTAAEDMMCFRYYDPDKLIIGKPMKEQLKFAFSWWHTLCAEGTDMFGGATMDKSFGAPADPIARAKAKIDTGFALMQALGISYFCFHDVDLVEEADTLRESNRRLDEVSDYLLQKMQETGIRCLWGTCNTFFNKRFMHGAGTSPSADIFAYAAAKIKKAIDITHKLGGAGYVFWGGREGYETLLNTDVQMELDNMARLMHMAIDYADSIGFTGDFYIEPKPKEPTKHQYDFDVATSCNFLRTYGLEKRFKMNVEANHSNKRSYYGIRNMSDRLCRENGLSVVVPQKGGKGKSYAEYIAEKTGTSWKGKLKISVDGLIPQVSSFEELLSRLQGLGYEIKPGKYVSCRAPGQERFTRLKTLGADYTEEAIRERIEGRRTRTAKAPKAERGVSLLIDIENSIKAAQSRGYEQWAKIHNLKQAAKTLNFLTEHQISRYEDLTAKITEIQTESDKAGDALKEVEKRLADMAVLIKNVSTFQKTKPAYDTYRKARNKERYRAAHEGTVILHEAAAKALKAAGISKLPNLAALQAEYEKLQEQKEALRADYGKLKKQVREYDVIKQNIDSILRQPWEIANEKNLSR